jgi:hypothetical protein
LIQFYTSEKAANTWLLFSSKKARFTFAQQQRGRRDWRTPAARSFWVGRSEADRHRSAPLRANNSPPNRNFAPSSATGECTQVAIYDSLAFVIENWHIFRRYDFVIFVEIERKNKDVSSCDETSLSILG